jgi:hypothetical protein
MIRFSWMLLHVLLWTGSWAQSTLETLECTATLQTERDKLRQSLHARTIGETFRGDPTPDFEYRYESAFWAVSQFLVDDSLVREGFRKTMQAYEQLSPGTRRAFLEALYAVDPPGYESGMESILRKEPIPKLFAMATLHLTRRRPETSDGILALMRSRWPDHKSDPILSSLEDHLTKGTDHLRSGLPDLHDWFNLQRHRGVKTVYSLQRWNRDYGGIAIVQEADGGFARDSTGRLITVRQLARSASNLPYFITNGNTPQGVFRITGIGRSSNTFIGPTPNLQMVMPFEWTWKVFNPKETDTTDPVSSYSRLLPEGWRNYAPVYESFKAGKAGRTEIIAHGTTIDPEYFNGKPYHPASPTLGCLCAPESWDPLTGRLKESEQWLLTRAFVRSGDSTGYLVVINLDDRHEAVDPSEAEAIVAGYERKVGRHPANSPRPVR